MKPLTNLRHRRLRTALSAFCRFPVTTWKSICAASKRALTRCQSAWNEQRKAAASYDQARTAMLAGRPIISVLMRDKFTLLAQENRAALMPGAGALRLSKTLR